MVYAHRWLEGYEKKNKTRNGYESSEGCRSVALIYSEENIKCYK